VRWGRGAGAGAASMWVSRGRGSVNVGQQGAGPAGSSFQSSAQGLPAGLRSRVWQAC
jgi:hypothetical protein